MKQKKGWAKEEEEINERGNGQRSIRRDRRKRNRRRARGNKERRGEVVNE